LPVKRDDNAPKIRNVNNNKSGKTLWGNHQPVQVVADSSWTIEFYEKVFGQISDLMVKKLSY